MRQLTAHDPAALSEYPMTTNRDRGQTRRRFLTRLAGLGVGMAAWPDDLTGKVPVLPAGAGPDGGDHRADPYALVLGTTQDAGMPQVGCYADRCERARQRAQPRFAASLALVEPDQERFYLVDATPDITRQLDLVDEPAFRRRAAERRPFDGIFLTHAHIGHYAGLAVLGREGLGIAPTPTYCTEAMADFLRSNGPWELMVREGRLDLRPVTPLRWTRIDDQLEARCVRVPHRREYSDTVGWIFRGPTRSLLYLPDIDSWELWNLDIEAMVESVGTALIDATFYSAEEVPGRSIEDIPHPLVPHSMDRLEERVTAGDRVIFTHLNNTNPALFEDSEEAAEVRRRGFEIATEGLRIPL
jgi:pyrroloquinoline quinone biosynthesis protein B